MQYQISPTITIAIEGPNKSGKTTLANALRQFGARVYHSGGPKKTKEELARCCAEFSSMTGVVIDRFPVISQIAYDVALSRPPLIAHSTLIEHLTTRRRALGALHVVYCRPPTELMLKERMQETETNPKEHAELIERKRLDLIAVYDNLIWSLSAAGLIQPVLYDWTESSVSVLVNILVSGAALEKTLCAG